MIVGVENRSEILLGYLGMYGMQSWTYRRILSNFLKIDFLASRTHIYLQSGRLKTTSEEKVKCIRGLKNLLWGLEKKKFGQEKGQNHAFFKIKISVKSGFLAKHLDFRVLEKLFYASLGYIVGIENVLLV